MKNFLFFIFLLFSVPAFADKPNTNDDTISLSQSIDAQEKDSELKENESTFFGSWKFYFIILIFPLMLLFIFIVVARGKK